MERPELLRIACWALAGVLVVALGASLLRAREGPEPAPVELSGPGSKRPGTAAHRRARPAYVSVAGEVRHPGLVRMRAGARVGMAVRRAGGLTRRADTAGVNLAERLRDGQQVVVPRRGAPPASGPAAAPAPGGASAPAAKVSLAGATVEQLDTLDGIGPTLAQRIVRERDSRGGFQSVAELRTVEGIGEKRFATLRSALEP